MAPTLTGWFARANPFAFDPLTLDFAADARRFQTGTPAVVAAFTANAARRLLEPVGVDRVWAHVQALGADLTERLRRQGLPLFSPAEPSLRGPQVSVVADEADAVARALGERGIVVAPRGRAIRLSLHYYNTCADVDRVVGE